MSEPTIEERRKVMVDQIVEVEAILRRDLATDFYPPRLRGKAARTLRDMQRMKRRIGYPVDYGFPADGVSLGVSGGQA